jgi:pimeloyl-ACP methyl ester carboxylesterase
MTQHAELSTRVRSYRTTGVDSKIHDLATDLERREKRQIIMIHGFNVSEESAREVYDGFLKVFRNANLIRDEGSLGLFRAFHWPGNHPSRVASGVGYNSRIESANESGRLLAKYLGRLKPKQQVHIVAHSLGCRVALSALARIHRRGSRYAGATVVSVFLLAAAVPTEFCEKGNKPFGFQVASSGEYAYFSHSDGILKWLFPAGQRLFGEPGHAVGRHGGPADRWTGDPRKTRLGHGDYWSAKDIAKDIGHALGVVPPRGLPTNISRATKFASVRRILPRWKPNTRRLGDSPRH